MASDPKSQSILILDFGSQTTQLIARRIRENKVYCEIHPYSIPLSKIKEMAPRGLILSGGPSSVYDPHAPTVDKALFDLGIPILGICYGMQLTTHLLGGTVEKSTKREYGPAMIEVLHNDPLFKGLSAKDRKYKVWMSHGDRIQEAAPGFKAIASTESTPFAAMAHLERPIYGVQFHPEVVHTEIGQEILKNFLFEICGLDPL